ncbi:T9SS type A sorting domain-containing protein [Flammeovirga pectinis]|uniref:T9SS type A sorting domain-containing protein n=1 Tax=Flammeovirga pectinis TaxID=2494373 RepID=A0A3Q9FUY0_9BACT|nr:leucine-rich repeat protein [Flammeovirga pectinis]AZQ64987.1 T9SS type A sorting domain-containing protein [Flammeovirga pectinis]
MKKNLFYIFVFLLNSLSSYSQGHLLTELDVKIVDGQIINYLSSYNNIIIPPFLDGQTVTSIGESAFSHNSLTTVSLPNTVTSIGENAFSNNLLTTVILPNTVTSIGKNAFSHNSLTTVSFPNSIESIGAFAFRFNLLTSVNIPSSVIIIGEYAFSDNQLISFSLPSPVVEGAWNVSASGEEVTDLTIQYVYNYSSPHVITFSEVELKNGVITAYFGPSGKVKIPEIINGETIIEIGKGAFSHKILTSVEFPNSITTIGENSFSHNLLTAISFPSSITTIGENAFVSNKLSSVDIPNSINSIGAFAFSNNKLTSLDISSLVTIIEEGTFSYNKLTSLELPNSIITIEASAFSQNKLSSIELPNSVTTIGDGAFSANKLTSVVLPSSLKSLGAAAFFLNQLESIELPSSLTTIGDYSFSNNSLTSVEFPMLLTTIGKQAFSSNQLESIELPSSLTIIGDNAFTSNLLKSIAFPSSLKSIGQQAFSHNLLTSIVLPNSVMIIGKYAFYHNQIQSFSLPVPVIDGVWNLGVSGEEVTDFEVTYVFNSGNRLISSSEILFEDGIIKDYYGPGGIIEIPTLIDNEVVVAIGDYAFSDNVLTSVVLPNSLTTIGKGSFSGNLLSSVNIPSSVIMIGDYAFAGNSLISVVLPDLLTTLGEGIFSSNLLSSVNIPSSVSMIGDYVFSDNLLTSVVLPNSVTSIAEGAFYGNRLTSVKLPNSIKSIGARAFSFNLLKSIELPSSIINIGAFAFWDNLLLSIEIPNSVTSIAEGTFYGNRLTSVKLPNSITSIGARAFSYNGLGSFFLPHVMNEDSIFTIDGWTSSNGIEYNNGDEIFSLEDSYNINVKSYNGALVSILFKNTTGNLIIKGDIDTTYNTIDNVNFIALKGSNLELTANVSQIDNGYELFPSVVNIDNLQDNIQQVFKVVPINYRIVYHNVEYSEGISNYTIESASFDLSVPPLVEGYTFEGWYSEADFINKITEISSGSTGDITLYAKLIPVSYSINYELEGGLHHNILSYTILTSTLSLLEATKEGYTFEGWYSEADFINKITEISSGSTGDITLYAKLIPVSYSINYELKGGLHQNVLSYTILTSTLSLLEATKEGYTFEGWYSEADFINKITEIPKGSIGDITLYAKWSLNEITSLFSSEGEILIYPNPVLSSYFQLKSTIQIIKVSIFDLNGKILKTFRPEKIFDIKELPVGVYLIDIHTVKGVIHKKIIKQ